ncbi:MAG: hypothetical protein A2Z88_01970 [Omnitrophica WOR_2 bacterium GWA2_47_8]|nr:MAG: hypothetical protein A2Z88_01970 [Omnitrophica WOR_2 bacterium GWA2_47_8]
MNISETQAYLNSLLQNIRHPRIGTVIGLQEEVGELCKCIMDWEIYGKTDKINLGEECADVLFSVIDICNAYGIDLEKVSEGKLNNMKVKIADWEKKYGESLKHRRDILDQV